MTISKRHLQSSKLSSLCYTVGSYQLSILSETSIILYINYESVLVIQSCPTLCDPMNYSQLGSFVMAFPREDYQRGCRFLLQRILATQGLNPHCLYWQAHSLPLSHQGSPMVMLPNLIVLVILLYIIIKLYTLNLHNTICQLYLSKAGVWRRKRQPTPVILPRESCGQRILVGCCPQGRAVRHD